MPYALRISTALIAKSEDDPQVRAQIQLQDPYVLAQLEFERRAVEKLESVSLLTSFDLYAWTCQIVIWGAQQRMPFVSDTLADLEVDADKRRNMRTLAFRRSAERVIVGKRAALVRLIDRLDKEPNLFVSVYAPHKCPLLDNDNNPQASLQRIRPQLAGAGGNQCNQWLDAVLKTFDEAAPASVARLRILRRAGSAEGLATFVNTVKTGAVLEALVDSIIRDFKRRGSEGRFGAADCQAMLRALRVKNPPDIAPGTAEFRKLADQVKDCLLILAKEGAMPTLPTPAAKVLLGPDLAAIQTACDLVISKVKSAIGFDALQAARDLDPGNPLPREAVSELLIETEALIHSLNLSVAWTAPDGPTTQLTVRVPGPDGNTVEVPLGPFKPYVFYQLDEYRQAIGRLRGESVRDLADRWHKWVMCCSFDIPLIEVDGDSWHFINCEPHLYLMNEGQPDHLLFFNGAQFAGTPMNGTGRNLDTIRTLWAAQPEPANTGRHSAATRNRRARFSPRRSYDAVYRFRPAQIDTQMMWRKSSGFGGHMGRCDPRPPKEDYWWRFDGELDVIRDGLSSKLAEFPAAIDPKYLVQQMGKLMGLDGDRLLDQPPNVPGETVDGSTYLYGFFTRAGSTFVRCGGLAVPGFAFHYYRRVDGNRKVVKVAPGGRDFANRPTEYDVDRRHAVVGPAGKAVGINLPICLCDPRNFGIYDAWKTDLAAVIKNKGNVLRRSFRFRKDAGRVMSQAVAWIRPDVLGGKQYGSSLSASALAELVFGARDGRAAPFWADLKRTKLNALPTDQEWCHLQGHGDSGDERVGNFVSGSVHCNTEQLAIETGHRSITHAAAGSYMLRASAYLLPDASMRVEAGNEDTGTRSYLDLPAYIVNGYVHNPRRTSPEDAISRFQEDAGRARVNAPVAAFIRYRISKKSDDGWTKAVEYDFEGQGEFFDENQFFMLMYTVRYALDRDAYLTELAECFEPPIVMAAPQGMDTTS